MEPLADGLGQQVACNARQDHDGTRQGCNAAKLSRHVHADGRGNGFGQEGGVLLPGQAQRQRQGQCTAQADQRAHRDARNDGGGVLLEQIPLFIEGNGQADGGRQQQVVDRGSAGLVIRIRDVQHAEQDDNKDAAQQQRVKNGLARCPIDKSPQRKGGQREHYTPGGRAGKKSV